MNTHVRTATRHRRKPRLLTGGAGALHRLLAVSLLALAVNVLVPPPPAAAGLVPDCAYDSIWDFDRLPVVLDESYVGTTNHELKVSASDGILKNDTMEAIGSTASPLGSSWKPPKLWEAPTYGNVTIGEDGSFTYTPRSDLTIDKSYVDSFQYVLQHDTSRECSNPGTVTITLAASLPDPPGTTGETWAWRPGNIDLVVAAPGVLANDTNTVSPGSDESTLEAVIVSQPHWWLTPSQPAGQLLDWGVNRDGPNPIAMNDGSFVLRPAENDHGLLKFTYKVCYRIRSVALFPCSEPVAAHVRILPTLAAGADTYSTGSDTTLQVDAGHGIFANDFDNIEPSFWAAPGLGLWKQTFTHTQPSHGTVALNTSSGGFTYDPDAGFAGASTFTYSECWQRREETPICTGATTVTLNVAAGTPRVTSVAGPTETDPAFVVRVDQVLGGVDSSTLSVTPEGSTTPLAGTFSCFFEYAPSEMFPDGGMNPSKCDQSFNYVAFTPSTPVGGTQTFTVAINQNSGGFLASATGLRVPPTIRTVSVDLPSIATAPVITVPSSTVTAAETTSEAGASVPFTVTATGDPTPTIACTSGGATVASGDTFAAGSHTVSCTATNIEGSDSKSFTISVAAAPVPKTVQTITFDQPSSFEYGDAARTLTASASSGLPVTLTVTSGPESCSIADGKLTPRAVGTCTVTATQAGNDTYAEAESVGRDIRVNRQSVSYFVSGPSSLAYLNTETVGLSGAHFPSSELSSVTWSSTTPTLCEVTPGRYGAAVKALAASGTCTVQAAYAGSTNYTSASDTLDITLSKAGQAITFPAIADRVLGDAAFTVSPTSDSGLAVTLAAQGSCSVTAAGLVSLVGIGTCTITASLAGNDNYYAATDVPRSFTIATGLTVGAASDTQYSDSLTLSANVTGAYPGSVAFAVGGSSFCTAGVATSTGPSTTAGEARCSAAVTKPAGTYAVTAVFTPTDTTRNTVTATGQMRVTAENATVGYLGPQFVSTPSATATTASVALTAQVDQAADGSAGDVTKARVWFDLYDSSVSLTPARSVAGTVSATGLATATATNLPEGNWVVVVRLDAASPSYFAGPSSDATVLTVYVPLLGTWATGGGWVVDPSYRNLPVAVSPSRPKGNFGMSVRYKKGTTTPQGQSIYTFHGADGYDYIVKSTSWQAGGASFSKTAAGFAGKAVVQVFNPSTGVFVSGLGGGNFTFRVDVVDGTTDTYAISVYDAKGALYHQAGTTTAPLAVKGGNIAVHS